MNIDVSTIDKNGALYKKFMNSRNTNIERPMSQNLSQMNDVKIIPIKTHSIGPPTNEIPQSLNNNHSEDTIRPRQKRQTNKQYSNKKNQNPDLSNINKITFQSQRMPIMIGANTKRNEEAFFNIEPKQRQNSVIPKKNSSNFETVPITTKTFHNQETQDYKKKYERLQIQYQQLKDSILQQNKQKKKQMLENQQNLEIMKQRLYEVQSHEDELIIQNQRMKQKIQQESLIRTKLQQENKELNYKFQEMNDMLDGKQNSIKKKGQQVIYWKNQNDSLKSEIQNLTLQNQKLIERCDVIESQHNGVKHQKQNKQYLVEDLRERVSTLISENNVLKDQLYALTTKLYQLQQDNQTLRADVRRQRQSTPINSYFHEQVSQISNMRITQQNKSINPDNQRPNRDRKRGQFARERTQRNTEKKQDKQIKHEEPVKHNQSQRLKILHQQLQKLNDLKAMNGAMRRQKIEIERQIESIEAQMRK